MKTRLVLYSLTWLAVAAAGPASAELYKWVDEKGVVNYGDKPPAAARNVRALDDTNARLSVVPGLPPETMQRERERAAESRVEQLERQLQESQARERSASYAAAQAAAAASYAQPPEPQVVLYPVVRPPRHVVPPHRPPVRGVPVDRTRPQKVPPPAGMRLDLPG